MKSMNTIVALMVLAAAFVAVGCGDEKEPPPADQPQDTGGSVGGVINEAQQTAQEATRAAGEMAEEAMDAAEAAVDQATDDDSETVVVEVQPVEAYEADAKVTVTEDNAEDVLKNLEAEIDSEATDEPTSP